MKDRTKQMLLFGGGVLFSAMVLALLLKKKALRLKTDSKTIKGPNTSKLAELKSLLSEAVSEGWDTIKQTPELQVFKKITEDSPIAIIKARIVIENTIPDDVLFAIWDGNFRREWDTVIQNFHVVERTSEDADMIYFYAASPMPALVSNREFIQHRQYFKEGHSIYVVYWSADRDDIPVPEKWVRANTIISGYHIRKENTGVVVEFISQNDVKGKIPPKLINTLAPSKALDWVKKLRKACELLNRKKNS